MAKEDISINGGGAGAGGGIFPGVKNTFSSSIGGFADNNDIRFAPITNITGLSPGWPSELNVKVRESSWGGYEYNQSGVQYASGKRFMQNRGTSNFAPGNTWICVYAGTYRVLAWQNSTTISKNGSNVGSPLSQNQTITVVCAIGDHIQGSAPFSFYYSTSIPSLQGAYGGYSGYVFGTRNDRGTGGNINRLLVFPLDSDPTDTDLSKIYVGTQNSTAQSNPVVTGLPTSGLQLTGTDYGVNFFNAGLSTTNNYYVTSDVLICCWRGFTGGTDTKDTVSMFPMTTEAKYGWFSTGGHILAMAGPDQNRQGEVYQTTSIQQKYRNSTNTTTSTTTEFSTDNMGGADVEDVGNWAYTDSSVTSPGGTNYDESPSVVFTNPGALSSLGTNSEFSQAGTLFTCEQQADGDGTEMSNFVTEECMSTFTCNHGGGSYMAFLSTYFNSTDAATVLHFSDTRAYIATYALGVNSSTAIGYKMPNTPYQWTSTYIDGEVGFSPDAGDIFQITTPRSATTAAVMAAWGDTTATTEDETIFIIADTIGMVGGLPQSFVLIGNELSSAYGSGTKLAACNPDEPINITVYKYFDTTIPDAGLGDGFFTASGGTIQWTREQNIDVGGRFYKHSAGRTNYAVQMRDLPTTGQIESIESCSDRRIKKNIKKIDVSPSGINVYRFEFKDTKWGEGEFVGVMAQEVPQAARDSEGVLFVNYNLLDVNYQEWNGDNCNCKKNICYNCHPNN